MFARSGTFQIGRRAVDRGRCTFELNYGNIEFVQAERSVADCAGAYESVRPARRQRTVGVTLRLALRFGQLRQVS